MNILKMDKKWGAGIFMSKSRLVVKNCIFTNLRGLAGAAIAIEDSSPIIEDCFFFNNFSMLGTVVLSSSQSGWRFNRLSNSTFKNCTFMPMHLVTVMTMTLIAVLVLQLFFNGTKTEESKIVSLMPTKGEDYK